MEKNEISVVWTLEGIRAYLLDGKNPRDIGGADALANRPFPQGTYMPVFVREIHTKAEGLGHAIAKKTQEKYTDIATNLRSSPFVLDTAKQQARAEIEIVVIEIKGHIEHNTAEFLGQRDEAYNIGLVYRRDLQAAGSTHPRGGWKDFWDFGPVVVGILTIESGVGVAILWRALGATWAIVTGVSLSLVSLVGGMLSALALLRPTKQETITPLSRAAQWALAIFSGMMTLLLMYIGACKRSALIDGLDGNSADIHAKFMSPGDVLINFDVLTLAALGVVGFCVGAREFYGFYNGHRSLLRKSGIAKTHADEVLFETADELKAFVKKVGTNGANRLDDIARSNGEWVRSDADHRDNATAISLDANRSLDLLRRAFDGIVAEYKDGFQEVKPSVGTSEVSYPVIGVDDEVPSVIVDGRGAVIEAAVKVSDCVLAANIEISNIVTAAIVRIDLLGGFRVKPPGDDLLPPEGHTS